METYQMLLGTIIIGLIIAQLWSMISQHLRFRCMVNKIPGPKTLPFIGLALKLAKIQHEDLDAYFIKLAQEYKDGIYVVWVGNDPYIHLFKPRHFEVILPSTTLITKSKGYDVIVPWLGQGLLTSTGDLWARHRRLITPAFHFGVLEEFINIIIEKSEILNDILEKMTLSFPNEPIDICQYVGKYTLDIICETAMGIDMNGQRNSENRYATAVHRFSTLMTERFIWPWNLWDWYYKKTQAGKEFFGAIKTMHEYTEKLIEQKKKSRHQGTSDTEKIKQDDANDIGGRKRRAFLDLLLEESEKADHPLTDKEIREQVDTFMFAGHDTTTTTISWALFALGNAPEIQEKLRDEIVEFYGHDVKPTTNKQLAELKYLDRVLKEVLRLYPSAPFVNRHVTHDFVVDGYTIPKGATLQIDIMMLHRDAETWEDPLKFDPERFNPEVAKKKHPYSYVPFSAGPRNCIGQKFANMEVKLTLIALLQKWRVKSVKKHEEMKTCSNIVLRPFGSIYLYLSPVNST